DRIFGSRVAGPPLRGPGDDCRSPRSLKLMLMRPSFTRTRGGGRNQVPKTNNLYVLNMYSELTIFKNGLTLIATPLLVQAVFIGIPTKGQADSAEAQRWAIHTKEVIANVEEMRLGLVESYAGIRDLIFSGTSSLKRPSWDPQEWGSRQIEDLRTLVSDNPQ